MCKQCELNGLTTVVLIEKSNVESLTVLSAVGSKDFTAVDRAGSATSMGNEFYAGLHAKGYCDTYITWLLSVSCL